MLFYLQLFSEWLQSRKAQWRKTYATGRKLQSNKKSGKHVSKEEEGSSKQPAVLRPNTTSCETTTTGATTKKRKPVTDSSEQSKQQFTRPKKVVRFNHQVIVYQPQPQLQPVQIYTCSICRYRSFYSYEEACAH